jgi:hypothetical protein
MKVCLPSKHMEYFLKKMDFIWFFNKSGVGKGIFPNDIFCIMKDIKVINTVDRIVSINILFVLKFEKNDIFIESINVPWIVLDNSSCIVN